jgi:dolichol-phosphate mannosyltransferase
MKKISIIVPAYNEEKNIPLIYQQIISALKDVGMDWEMLYIDDHSQDSTAEQIELLATQDERVRGFRLSRNFGSHMAISCGFEKASGDCAVTMAADLQDPPKVIPDLLEKWEKGDQIVWAVREQREGERKRDIGLSRLYYFIMRRLAGLRELPPTGADFMLVDRVVIDAFNRFGEKNTSILALLSWMGFRQSFIAYDKQARQHGRSGWSFEKKLKLAIDSMASFSYLPLRLMVYIGIIIAILGFLYALVVVVNFMIGRSTPEGWPSLMVVILVVGGLQMFMMGILGEYLWRALDESRNRPKYIIEKEMGRNN